MTGRQRATKAKTTKATEATSTEDVAVIDTVDEASKTKKGVDLGTFTVGVSEDPVLNVRRASKLDTNPLAIAVRDATPGVVYDVTCEPGKEGTILSVLRRAANRFNKGLKTKKTDGLIKFMVGDKRQPKAKTTDTSAES